MKHSQLGEIVVHDQRKLRGCQVDQDMKGYDNSMLKKTFFKTNTEIDYLSRKLDLETDTRGQWNQGT